MNIDDKEILRELVKCNEEKRAFSHYIDQLYEKYNEIELNKLFGQLEKEGLIECLFADNRAYYVSLTYKGAHSFDSDALSDKDDKKHRKLFISHSSKDKQYVTLLVSDLLAKIGLHPDNVFCTSVPGFGIPVGRNIVETMYKQFQEYDLHMVYILSDNYYESAYCLNEMGAGWILQTNTTMMLLPGFSYKKIDGVIDEKEKGISFDESIGSIKANLNDFKDDIIYEMKLDQLNETEWENIRDSFIERMKSIKQDSTSSQDRNDRNEMIDINQLDSNDEKLLIYYIYKNELRTISLSDYQNWLVEQEIYDVNPLNGFSLLAEYDHGSYTNDQLVLGLKIFRSIQHINPETVNMLKAHFESKRKLSIDTFNNLYEKKKVPDSVILLFAYLRDNHSDSLGDGWQVEGEIEAIKIWEGKEKLIDGVLANSYCDSLQFLIKNNLCYPSAYTANGNVKERRLNRSLKCAILNKNSVFDSITQNIKYYNVDFDKLY